MPTQHPTNSNSNLTQVTSDTVVEMDTLNNQTNEIHENDLLKLIGECFVNYSTLYDKDWSETKLNEFHTKIINNTQQLCRLNRSVLPKYMNAFSVYHPLKQLRLVLIENLLTKLGLENQLQPIERRDIGKIQNEIVLVITLIAETDNGYQPDDKVLINFTNPKKQTKTNTKTSNEDIADSLLNMEMEIRDLKSTVDDQFSTIKEILNMVQKLTNDNVELKKIIIELKSKPTAPLYPTSIFSHPNSNSAIPTTNSNPVQFSFANMASKQTNQSPQVTSNARNQGLQNTPLNSLNNRKRTNSTSNSASYKRPYAGPHPKLTNYNSYDPEAPTKPIDNENDGYIEIKPKNRRLKPHQIIAKLGTNKDSSSLQTIPRKQRVFLASLHPDTTNDTVKAYLEKNLILKNSNGTEEVTTKIPFYNITENKPSQDTSKPKRSKSFTFEIDLFYRNVVEDKSIWPEGSFVDFSFFPKNKQRLAIINNTTTSTNNTTTTAI
jgi:hypothetical protein